MADILGEMMAQFAGNVASLEGCGDSSSSLAADAARGTKPSRTRARDDQSEAAHRPEPAPPCDACADSDRAWPVYLLAARQLEVSLPPYLMNLCPAHADQVPAELVTVRRVWSDAGWILQTRRAPDVGCRLPAVRPRLNATLAMSGIY